MRQKSDVFLRIALILGDGMMLVLSFAAAYAIRVHVDPRPYEFESQLFEFTKEIVWLVPIMWVVLAALGLYKKSVFFNKSRLPEVGRVLMGSVLAVSALIVYDFFTGRELFPVRVVAIVAVVLAFLSLMLERLVVMWLVRRMFREGRGVRRAIIIGNNKNTEYLADYISAAPESGYRVAAIVAGKRFIPKDLTEYQHPSLKDALKKCRVDVIFQTDEKSTEYVYGQAIKRHLTYYFVPSETTLSSHFGELELIGNTPAVMVKLTPLSGGAAVVKRVMDIVLSAMAIIVLAIPMGIVWLIVKLSDPSAPAIYKDERLTQYNRKFKCYKFRTMKPEWSGMTAEEAFEKMGREDLIAPYRAGGDYMADDPRISPVGRVLRRLSIDELPQFFNVFRGDISLIGPRALLPGELRDYGDRSLILAVKSGLTGLAQVSGRRNISFEERRAIDIYYVMNWSLALDARIFFRTIVAVLRRDGAK